MSNRDNGLCRSALSTFALLLLSAMKNTGHKDTEGGKSDNCAKTFKLFAGNPFFQVFSLWICLGFFGWVSFFGGWVFWGLWGFFVWVCF